MNKHRTIGTIEKDEDGKTIGARFTCTDCDYERLITPDGGKLINKGDQGVRHCGSMCGDAEMEITVEVKQRDYLAPFGEFLSGDY